PLRSLARRAARPPSPAPHTRPNPLRERLTDGSAKDPAQAKKHHDECDNRHGLVEQEVQIQARGHGGHRGRGCLNHADAVRLSVTWSFPGRLARRSELLALVLLGQEPLRKIYPLREFRHFPAQLLHRRGQLLMPRVRSGYLTMRLQLGGVHFAQGPHDHQGEEPADGGDGDQDSHGFGVHQLLGGASRSASRCLASRRSVTSIRSPNSATSRRICCSSCTTSSRSASISSLIAVSDLCRRLSAKPRTNEE